MQYCEPELGIELNAKNVLLWLLDIALWFVLLPVRISVMVFQIIRRMCYGIDFGLFWILPLIYLVVFSVMILICMVSGVNISS